ncbi:MlaD family protein [Antrihabitans stalactiti]|uniref:MCE family protein n=1 Tax=Antrihabitans stalactiti TaxID=2584121 RepID=A0A848KG80_9NOCA|nr:MlaD family protein [Antrihabitans stalactiti]NMN96688.1 MCE family protein [Antrihabitans stalactiti]
MTTKQTLRLGIGAIALCCSVFTASGCGIGPKDLPSPQAGVGDAYEVTLQFASAMNLPTGAYVMMNGLRVGEVRNVAVVDQRVDVTVGLKSEAQVPSDVRAVIRQDTLLGDTYIAFDHDPVKPTSTFLAAGDAVPVDRTTSPPQLEDTMAVLAYFINGGSIQKSEDTIARLNNVMPSAADVSRLANIAAVDLRDLAGNTTEIDRTLAGLDATSVAISDKKSILDLTMTDEGLKFWRLSAKSILAHISILLPSIGSIFEGGMWMVPMLDSLSATATTGRNIFDEAPTAAEKISTFIRTTLLPFAKNPSVNIRSIETPAGEQLATEVENLLRMLGAVR